MKKAFFVIDEPKCCAECHMHFKDVQIHTGNFTYRQLFRCNIEPEGIEDCYLQDILHQKPDWCPLKSVENVLERLEEYRDDFMDAIYDELQEDTDNLRANRIIDRFDEAIEIIKEGLK